MEVRGSLFQKCNIIIILFSRLNDTARDIFLHSITSEPMKLIWTGLRWFGWREGHYSNNKKCLLCPCCVLLYCLWLCGYSLCLSDAVRNVMSLHKGVSFWRLQLENTTLDGAVITAVWPTAEIGKGSNQAHKVIFSRL